MRGRSVLVTATLLIIGFLSGTIASAAEPAWKREKWPDGRQLVWAEPGKGGEFGEAKNWRERGRPAGTAPDRETDVLLPKSSKHYVVKGSRLDQVRHVRIESNAELNGKHRNELEIWGNVDVEPGGDIHFISIRGDRDTYFDIKDAVFPGDDRKYRHCTTHLPLERRCNSQISHKFQIAKIGTKSVEFVGNVGVSDEVMLQHGKAIISGEFRFSGATNKGAFEVYDGGILEIQSGGRVAPFISENRKGVFNVNIYRNGVLQAGSPERPLTSDAYLCLGFAENDKPGRSGLYAALGSFIRVYTTDPDRARLVVTSITSVDGFTNGQGQPVGNKNEAASGNKGVALQLAGDVHLDGVMFDYLAEDGLGLLDPEVAEEWRHVSFGPKCAGPVQKLVTKMTADPNTYYHPRGDQKSEYGLTTAAVKSLNEHLNDYDPFQLRAYPDNTELRSIGGGVKTPVAVIFEDEVTVEIKTKVPGAKIRYTTDGSEPTGESFAYTGPFKLNRTRKLTVKAYKKGVGLSPTYTTVYVIK